MPPEARSRSGKRVFKATDSGPASLVASSVDLLVKILMQLSAKPLLRLKCVSKQWYSIISHPSFITEYAKRNPNPRLGLLLSGRLEQYSGPNPEFSFISLGGFDKIVRDPEFLKIPKIEIHHLCNGLLCYSQPHMDCPQLCSYYVCDSASGKSRRLRVLDSSTGKRFMCVNLSFDPLKSLSFQLIFVTEASGSELNQLINIDIYSSKTQSWRPCSKGPFIVPYDVDFSNGVHWNNAIYWYHRKKNSLSCFSFEDDTIEKLQMPLLSQGSYPMAFEYFGKSNGHLHLVGICRPSMTLFTVFEMQKDNSGWFVKCNGNLDALATNFPQHDMFTPVSLLRGEKDEELSIVFASSGSVVWYNVKEKTSKKLCDLRKSFVFDQLTVFPYMETLASI